MTVSLADKLRSMQALSVIAPSAPAEAPAEDPAPEDHAPAIPRPHQRAPALPPGMKDRARGIWTETVAELERLGVISVLDQGVLHRYCILRTEWEELAALLRRRDARYYSDSGSLSGAFVARRAVAAELSLLEAQLGMTPISRPKLLFSVYGARAIGSPGASRSEKAAGAPRGPRGAYRKKEAP